MGEEKQLVFSELPVRVAGASALNRIVDLYTCTEGKGKKVGQGKKGREDLWLHTVLLCHHFKTHPSQSCSLQIQTLIENNLPPRLHNLTFPIKKHSAGFLRRSFDEFIWGTDCFTIFGSQWNCERDSLGFLCRKCEGGEEEAASNALWFCAVSLM